MRHGRRQLLPGATGRVYLGRLDLRQGTGGSRLVRSMEHLVLAGRHRAGRALLADHVHDILAGAQALGSRSVWLLTWSMCCCTWSTSCCCGVCCDVSPCRAPGPWPRYSRSIPCMSSRWPGSSDARICSPAFSTWPQHFAGSVPWTDVGDSRPDFRDPTATTSAFAISLAALALDSIHLPRPGLYLAALGLFVAAMLSKSVAVTLPVAFAIWLWWKHGRVMWTDAWRIAPFFLVAMGIALADLSYYTSGRELSFDYGLPERALIAARALWFYAAKVVWPAEPGGHLSVVGHRHRRSARLGLPDRRRRGRGIALGWPSSAGEGPSRRRGVLRGDVGADARLRGFRLHATLFCRRALRVPRRHRRHGGSHRCRRPPRGQAAEYP